MHPLHTASLVLAGIISPLLTFAYLWQVKEWRIDRLREHLRAEGVFRQLFGLVRPAILLLAFLIIPHVPHAPALSIQAILVVFAALSLVQIGMKRQRMPVWTQKGITLVGTSLMLNAIASFVFPLILLPILVLLQPIVLLCAWLLFWPLDKVLKGRIMENAKAIRSKQSDLIVIGITGSAGKTTTKELLSHLLHDEKIAVTPAYVNTEMGVSQWITRTLTAEKPRILIVEMGAYRPGEITLLCNIAQPTMGIVTFVGSQHIALFGSQERLQHAKGELVAALPADGKAFLNADSTLCAELSKRASCPVTTIGTGGSVNMKATDIEETASGLRFRMEDMQYSTPLHGTHNITNILLAIAVAKELGKDDAHIQKALKSFRTPQHTFNVRKEGERTMLDDTHNASPASFRAGIQWARSQPAQQKILITSGLIELGRNQDKIHTELGAAAAEVFDRVIFLSKTSARAFEKGYGKSVELLPKTEPIGKAALVACIGRVSPSTISALLK